MEEQIFLDRLVNRYLSNEATSEELSVFLHLLKQGKLDTTLNRIIDKQTTSEKDDSE